jgi:hypothetical protein
VLVFVIFFESGLVGVLVRMDLVVVTVLVVVLGVLVVVYLVSVGVDGFAVPMLVLVCLVVPVLGHRAPFS